MVIFDGCKMETTYYYCPEQVNHCAVLFSVLDECSLQCGKPCISGSHDKTDHRSPEHQDFQHHHVCGFY